MDDRDAALLVAIARPVQADQPGTGPALDVERRRAEATFVASLSHDIQASLSAIMTLSDPRQRTLTVPHHAAPTGAR